ncbi:MAG: dihydroneopterin aldolase [Ferruginibacter sp.]
MFTIHLHKARFFAYHGIHEEERILGNTYELDIDCVYAESGQVQTLEQTIDYGKLYSLAAAIMARPTPLLETVVQHIAMAVRDEFPAVKHIRIRLMKLHPPIPGIEGLTGVTYSMDY